LRREGYNARALSEDEQLTLEIAPSSNAKIAAQKSKSKRVRVVAKPGSCNPQRATPDQQDATASCANSFLAFSETCAQIAADSRKLEKIRLLAEYLRTLEPQALVLAVAWFTGRPFPSSHNKVLQLGWAVLRDALCAVGGIDEFGLHQIYLKHSDSGETAMEVLRHCSSAATLSTERVGQIFERLHQARGPLAKTPVLREALEQCTPIEAKFLVKIISGDLRIGLKEGLVEVAVASAFNVKPDEVREANLLVGDIAEVARLAAQHQLKQATLVPFRPIKFMLASPEPTAEALWDRVKG